MTHEQTTARRRLTNLWQRSWFDRDCTTVEEYAAKTARRINKAYGVTIPPDDLEAIWAFLSDEKKTSRNVNTGLAMFGLVSIIKVLMGG